MNMLRWSITEYLFPKHIMKNNKIVLASASPRRRELLAQIGLTFEVRPSQAEEVTESQEPAEIVMELSQLKAADVFDKLPEDEKENTLVIGADTVVTLDGCIMGKPGSEKEAIKMISRLQGRTHQVYTGVTLIWQDAGESDCVGCEKKEKVFFEETSVNIYPMVEEEIKAYVATGEPMDKAGSYAIQGVFAAYIKGICGDYNNVVGLPVGRLYQELKKI